MAERRELRIPKADREGIELFLKLSTDQLRRVWELFETADPTLRAETLAPKLAETLRVAPREAEDLLRVLTSLYTSYEAVGSPVEAFSEGLKGAISKLELSIPEDYEVRIRELIALDRSLGATAKAMDVLTELERGFCDARVVTELRPIFGSDPTAPPTAFGVVHQLRIGFHEHAGDHSNVYIGLDSKDLLTLRAVLDRALKKEATLARTAADARLKLLEW